MPKPSSLMSQPMMCSVPRQQYSPLARMRGPARAPVLRIVQQQTSRAVAEQRARNKHRRAFIVGAHAQAAKVDGEKQHVRAVAGMGEPRGARQTGDAGAAAEPENRQPLDCRFELQPVAEFGVEARDRKPGDRVGHDHVDRIETDAGGFRRLDGHLFQKIERMFLKCRGAFFPAMRLEIPLDRLAIVTALDAGIVVKLAKSV